MKLPLPLLGSGLAALSVGASLAGLLPGKPVSFLSAAGILACSASLLLQDPVMRSRRLLAGTLGAFPALLGIWALAGTMLPLPFAPAAVPSTAFGFLLLGAGLVSLARGGAPEVRSATWSAGTAFMIALTALLARAYGARDTTGFASFSAMTFPTSAAFLALSIGILFARPDSSFSALFSSPGPGGVMARLLVPAAVLVPALMGWLEVAGERRGLYSARFGTAAMVVLLADLLVLIVYATAKGLDRADARRRKAEEELKRISALDGLTGVPNRRLFDRTLEMEWRRGLRSGETLGLVMIDIDHFKAYNDALGHLAGDECLKRVASALAGALGRPADLLARFGGEEFVAVLPGTGLEGAKAVAETLRKAVWDLAVPHPKGSTVTVSLGVASRVPSADVPPQALVASADGALYRAKASGRNAVIAA